MITLELDKKEFLRILNLSRELLFELSPDGEVNVLGKNNYYVLYQKTIDGEFPILEDFYFILSDESIKGIITFLKSIEGDSFEILLDENFPEITIEGLLKDFNNKGSLTVSIDFDYEEEDIELLNKFIEVEKGDVKANFPVSNSLIEGFNRANKFIDGRSEVEDARYLKLSVKNEAWKILGFTGVSGYEESVYVPSDLSVEPQYEENKLYQIFIKSSYLRDIHKHRRMFDSISIKDDYYTLNAHCCTLYIEIPDVRDLKFENLIYNQEWNEYKIDLDMFEYSLKAIPNSGRKDGIVKLTLNSKITIGTNTLCFELADNKFSDGDTKNFYFSSKFIRDYISNVKKLKISDIYLCMEKNNEKLLKLKAVSSTASARMIIAGLQYEDDDMVFA